ncbi:MAG: AAA family ATPase [Chryseobacterium sp.]|nr:MAG: AAA family ATPase [Chryseobacterium sp.]
MELKKASRKQVKLKLNLSAPSGSGKTMSALRMAYGLVGDWTKIGLVDTENGSASLYSHLGEFNTIDMQPPFTPEKYIQAIDICEKAGMDLVILDSSTHEWITLCAENEILANTSFRGNTWAAWSKTTPRHDAFVNKVLHTPMHFITCTRSKTETVQEGGKVKKIGMKDQQRDGWEYELTVSLEIDRDTHFATPSKDRTQLFEGGQPFLITEETGLKIKEWCEKGVFEKTSEEKLKECTNNTELAMVYKSLPVNEQIRLKDLATELKSKFNGGVDYEKELKGQKDIASLSAYFKAMPLDKQKEYAKLAGELKAAFEAEANRTPLYMTDKDYKNFLTRLKKSGEPEYTKAKEFSDFTPEQETEIANILAGMKSAA